VRMNNKCNRFWKPKQWTNTSTLDVIIGVIKEISCKTGQLHRGLYLHLPGSVVGIVARPGYIYMNSPQHNEMEKRGTPWERGTEH
jgi:hypothetical protein